MVLSRIKSWWDNLADEVPEPADKERLKISPEEIERIKQKKTVTAQEAFDLLYYDKVSQLELGNHIDNHLELRDRVDNLERKLDGYIAFLEAFNQTKLTGNQTKLTTNKDGLKTVRTTQKWNGKPIVFEDVGGE